MHFCEGVDEGRRTAILRIVWSFTLTFKDLYSHLEIHVGEHPLKLIFYI
jgi:hypothetical protein